MITKIQLKLNNDVLSTIIQILEQTNNQKIDTLNLALLHSIKDDLLVKFEEKAKNIQKQTSILDHNKKHNFILKYHEAYALHQLLSETISSENLQGHPHLKKIGRLITELHGKTLLFSEEKESDSLKKTAESGQGQTSLF